MALGYPYQHPIVVIGSKDSSGNITGATLTDAYGNSNTTAIVDTGGMSKLELHIGYTQGSGESGNSIQIRVEASPDRVNWYRFTNDSTSGATSTLTQREFTFSAVSSAGTWDYISLPLDVSCDYVRISIKESGVAANYGKVFCEVTISGDK